MGDTSKDLAENPAIMLRDLCKRIITDAKIETRDSILAEFLVAHYAQELVEALAGAEAPLTPAQRAAWLRIKRALCARGCVRVGVEARKNLCVCSANNDNV